VEILVALFLIFLAIGILIAVAKRVIALVRRVLRFLGRYYVHILVIILLPIQMMISFPSLVVAAFKAHIGLGFGLAAAGIVGWTIFCRTCAKYPTLREEFTRLLVVWWLLIAVAATVCGMVFGPESADNYGYILIVMIYGSLGFAGIIAPLAVILRIIRLYFNKQELVKKIRSVPLDNALNLKTLVKKIGIKKIDWMVANLDRFISEGTVLPTAADDRYLRIMGEKGFIVCECEIIISYQGYTKLKKNAENYLLQNGPRSFERLVKEVTKSNRNHRFMFSTLNESVGEGIILIQDVSGGIDMSMMGNDSNRNADPKKRISKKHFTRMLDDGDDDDDDEVSGKTPEEEGGAWVFRHKDKPMKRTRRPAPPD
jgi:hypothetical protein